MNNFNIHPCNSLMHRTPKIPEPKKFVALYYPPGFVITGATAPLFFNGAFSPVRTTVSVAESRKVSELPNSEKTAVANAIGQECLNQITPVDLDTWLAPLAEEELLLHKRLEVL